ncbi:MAG TPA: hypothetical protein PKJ68_00110 [Candidatus Woesebacteria bacterium]|nr:hypothetical protein [Candidatus Woesebacteria bacterium]
MQFEISDTIRALVTPGDGSDPHCHLCAHRLCYLKQNGLRGTVVRLDPRESAAKQLRERYGLKTGLPGDQFNRNWARPDVAGGCVTCFANERCFVQRIMNE